MRRPTNLSHDENILPSPQQPPLSKSPPPTPSLKESRAFEHNRQRLKKAAALLRRARNAQAKVPAKPQQQQQSTWRIGARVDDSELGVEESEAEWGEARSLSLRVGVPEDADRERESARRAEVALSDLLIAQKPRRGREQDFEVIPPIRSVIVLDDISTPELDVDEPWEHVYASDADDNHTQTNHHTELSYAKIVALSYSS